MIRQHPARRPRLRRTHWQQVGVAGATLALVGLAAAPAHATLFHEILADGSVVTDNGNGTGTLTDSGFSYNIATKQYPGPDVNLPVVTQNQAYQGSSSLEFVLTPYAGTQKPGEKSMIDVAGSKQNDGPTFDEWRGLSFAVNLDPSFQDPPKGLMLSEFWQGSPMGPPVQLTVMPNSTQWEVGILNDADLANKTGPEWHPGGTLERGAWHTLALMVYPDYKGHGEVKVYQDGNVVMDLKNQTIGFDPSVIPTGATGYPPSMMNVCLGVYRQADVVRADVYYDRIRYADTYADLQ